jgi:hypothetical protein
MSREERTGWRDESLSRRHRAWGYDCPAVDIDFLMIEYNRGKPVALVDYKRYTARTPEPDNKNMQALIALADGYKDGPLPFLIVRYWPDTWAIEVIPMNECAKRFYKGYSRLTELQYVTSLYKMRTKSLDKARALVNTIAHNLNNILPPEESHEQLEDLG